MVDGVLSMVDGVLVDDLDYIVWTCLLLVMALAIGFSDG
jgi:hypothetical protein